MINDRNAECLFNAFNRTTVECKLAQKLQLKLHNKLLIELQ